MMPAAEGRGRSNADSALAYGIFALLFVCILFGSHVTVLDLPYFWDELGQFVPAALDIMREGAFIPKTALPNVHPPGLMSYLAGFWQLFGYSVENTRTAMLFLAAAGTLFVFMLAVHLGRGVAGLPAFSAVLFLLCCPLFFTQSMMAQLDMPAMAFTALALWLFFKERFAACSAACVVLVLMKETALTTPAVFGAWLLWERRWRPALLFLAPAFALAGWLLYLKAGTGHLLGNKEFTHYNVWFQFHPVRLPLTFIRRIFYIFVDNFRWIGTIAIFLAWKRTSIFRNRAWAITAAVFTGQLLIVTLFGGAALERYVMPMLPLFYIAAAVAIATLKTRARRTATACMAAGLVLAMFLPAFFPYPYENSLAVVDFVRLHEEAARFIEAQYPDKVVASAWPFPDCLRRPEFGYVAGPIEVRGLDNFNRETVLKLRDEPVDVLVVYSRTWEPRWGVAGLGLTKKLLGDYYFYAPQITAEEIQQELGMRSAGRYERGGQWIEIFVRSRTPDILVL